MAGSGEAGACATRVESAEGVGADWGAYYVEGGSGRVREGVVTQLGRELEAAVTRTQQLEAELAMERQRLTRLQQLFGGARAGAPSAEGMAAAVAAEGGAWGGRPWAGAFAERGPEGSSPSGETPGAGARAAAAAAPSVTVQPPDSLLPTMSESWAVSPEPVARLTPSASASSLTSSMASSVSPVPERMPALHSAPLTPPSTTALLTRCASTATSTAAVAAGANRARRERNRRRRELAPPGTTRYWSDSEHRLFLQALKLYGHRNLKAISAHVGTRNPTQVRTHIQKFFMRLAREARRLQQGTGNPNSSNSHGDGLNGDATGVEAEHSASGPAEAPMVTADEAGAAGSPAGCTCQVNAHGTVTTECALASERTETAAAADFKFDTKRTSFRSVPKSCGVHLLSLVAQEQIL